jgi:hypothetical protein
MSYPSYHVLSDLAIQFTIPNRRIVKKIIKDVRNDENLRIQQAGLLLFDKVESLRSTLARYRVQVEPVEIRNELQITLFLPPPPCPPPKPNRVPRRAQTEKFEPILYAISKDGRNAEERADTCSDGFEEEWITLYHYVSEAEMD